MFVILVYQHMHN